MIEQSYDSQENKIYQCDEIKLGNDLYQSLKNLADLQRQDTYLSNIIYKIVNNEMVKYFWEYNGVLFRNDEDHHAWQVCLPELLTTKIIDGVHSKFGHPGGYKTIGYIKKLYYWKSISKEMKKFVTFCDLCQRVKLQYINMGSPYRMVYSSEPGDLVSVDFFGPLTRSPRGMEYIFVVLDVLSKYVRLFPIKKENTDTILKKMFNVYFPEMGMPKRILCDYGTQFTSSKWENRLRQAEVNVIFSSIRHPQGNPVERVMKELSCLFRDFGKMGIVFPN